MTIATPSVSSATTPDGDRFFQLDWRAPELAADSATAAAVFARHRAMVVRDAVEPTLLASLMKTCEATDWTPDLHLLGDFLTEPTPKVARAVELLLMHPALLRWLESTTNCGPLAGTQGHIARTQPEENHRLRWHNDLNVPRRRLAITINLGTAAYEGAVFELRDVASQETLFRFVHDRPGDAVIFEVSSRSEHRVTRMVSGGPRQVFAGWFLAPG